MGVRPPTPRRGDAEITPGKPSVIVRLSAYHCCAARVSAYWSAADRPLSLPITGGGPVVLAIKRAISNDTGVSTERGRLALAV